MISATACHSVPGKAARGCSDAIDWPTAFTLHTAGNHLRASSRHFCSSAPQYFLLYEFPNQCRAPRASRTAEPDQRDGRFFFLVDLIQAFDLHLSQHLHQDDVPTSFDSGQLDTVFSKL